MGGKRWQEVVVPVSVLGVAAALAALPLVGAPRSWLVYAFHLFIFAAMASMWNLLAGYTGLVSLCQPAFLGLAGYALAIGSWVGVPWWAGLAGGAVVASLFALALSFAVFRLSGVYFSIGTLVVPEALRMVFYLWRPVGSSMQGAGAGYMVKGTEGISTDFVYWLAFVVAAGSIVVVRVILRSNLGLALSAIRDNQRAAASPGVNVFRLKLCIFAISAAITGLAGGVYYLNQGYVEPTATFNSRWTMILLLATVIGGIRSEEGPVIGSVLFVFLYFALARYGGYNLLIQGGLLILVMVASPRGVVGLLRQSSGYRRLTRCTPRTGCVAVKDVSVELD